MHTEAVGSYCSEGAHGSRLASKWTIGGSSMLKGIRCVGNYKEHTGKITRYSFKNAGGKVGCGCLTTRGGLRSAVARKNFLILQARP